MKCSPVHYSRLCERKPTKAEADMQGMLKRNLIPLLLVSFLISALFLSVCFPLAKHGVRFLRELEVVYWVVCGDSNANLPEGLGSAAYSEAGVAYKGKRQSCAWGAGTTRAA